MRVLVIATHADDEVLGCGGSIAQHITNGDEVQIVYVTAGDPAVFQQSEIDAVASERQQAAAILGVKDTVALGYPAPRLDSIPNYEIAARLTTLVRSYRPECVYLPYHHDRHLDHQLTAQAALVACRPEPGSSVREVLCYETLSETEWADPGKGFVPNVFRDITLFLETKLKAMAAYRSQLKEPPHPRSLETLRALARVRGSHVNLPFAEAFVSVRKVYP